MSNLLTANILYAYETYPANHKTSKKSCRLKQKRTTIVRFTFIHITKVLKNYKNKIY